MGPKSDVCLHPSQNLLKCHFCNPWHSRAWCSHLLQPRHEDRYSKMGEVVQSVIFKKLFWLLKKISVEIFLRKDCISFPQATRGICEPDQLVCFLLFHFEGFAPAAFMKVLIHFRSTKSNSEATLLFRNH